MKTNLFKKLISIWLVLFFVLGAANAAYDPDTSKIDSKATLGLLGTANSLAYRIHEIETHLHSGARWFGVAVTPTATHFADRIGAGVLPFTVDGGNLAWGDWVQILGSGDTPLRSGFTHFDPHLITFTYAEKTGVYLFQIGRGASGAEALANETYTELVVWGEKLGGGDIPVQSGRAPAGSLLWARCMAYGENTGELKFYYGIHEYPG